MQKKKMKKKADWLTKAKKRKAKKTDRGIVDVMMLIRHFFKELPQWLNEMADPRNPSYITYSQSDLVLMGILKNMCAVKSMRSMEETFNEQPCIDTLRFLSGDQSEEHTSELQSRFDLVCRLLLEKKKKELTIV